MKWRVSTVAAVAICAAMAGAAVAGDKLPATGAAKATDATYSLGDAGDLKLSLPVGWTGESDGQTPPTITLKSPAGEHVSIQVTAVPGDATDAKVKAAAQAVGDLQYAPNSKEKKVTLEEVKGTGVHGWVSSYTDGSADPGEFRYVTAGSLACNGHVLAVTVLYNDKVSVDHTAATAALKTFSMPAAAGGAATTKPAAAAGPATTIDSPDGKWTLTIPGTWTVADDQKSGDGKSREVTATSADGSETMTVFLEPAAKAKGDAKAARDFYLNRMKRNPLGMDHLKKDAVGDVATLDYDQGPAELKMHNLNAYVARDGVWVDVHVSKVGWDEKADRPTFDAVVKGLKAEARK